MSLIDTDAIAALKTQHEPFDYFMGTGALKPDAIKPLHDSFPDIKSTGFHPLEQMKREGAFADLIREIESPAFTAAVSKAFSLWNPRSVIGPPRSLIEFQLLFDN